MSNVTYEATVHSTTVAYKNFKGTVRDVELHFALDPLQLMSVIAGFEGKKSKSGNPSKRAEDFVMSDEEQIRLVRKLAGLAAGWPSDDGESWESMTNFDETLAGKAFLVKLVTSDHDRKLFANNVILEPFRAYVNYAKADTSNSEKEIKEYELMLTQMENIFTDKPAPSESREDRRLRLAAELASFDEDND